MDVTQDKIQKMLAPGIPMPESLDIKLDTIQARNLAFLLMEAYSNWDMQLNHHMQEADGVYPEEVMELLDTIDSVRDQLVDQGIEWDPEA